MKLPLLFLQALPSLSSATLNIPRPGGPYGVNVATLGLTDSSRLDPFSPTPENRSVVISVFYPLRPADGCEWKLVPVYPKRTAAVFDAEVAFAGVTNGTLETVRMEVCVSKKAPLREYCANNASQIPVVLFSGGLGLSRLWYSALAQSVASFGFMVVTIDHPYDADVVEFPDGRIAYAINSTWDDAQSEQDVNVRTKDASFVLNELSKPGTINELFSGQCPPSQRTGLATKRTGIFGHSIGGATAAMAMFEDNRIVSGINLDGGLYGPVIKQGLTNPFLLFSHKDNSTTETWPDIWPHLNWKSEIEIVNSTHTTFTDIPLLADLIFGLPLPGFVQGVVGNIPGKRVRDVVTAYVVAMMKMALKCEPQALLQRPDPAFPEIEFVASPHRGK
ncbi:hypothetical protein H2200_000589 [Cladophialophora chaetospira]|uniref:1-alkyl-2-acetylglycerophosphocholine esterase n=1 Tax=Cladophialophora chaetospira TaxID=386627 RepID=A0AA39CPB5_9EURO|nr:hypothetical protein H2200_000589 [Cladophialophora chaetospira]